MGTVHSTDGSGGSFSHVKERYRAAPDLSLGCPTGGGACDDRLHGLRDVGVPEMETQISGQQSVAPPDDRVVPQHSTR